MTNDFWDTLWEIVHAVIFNVLLLPSRSCKYVCIQFNVCCIDVWYMYTSGFVYLIYFYFRVVLLILELLCGALSIYIYVFNMYVEKRMLRMLDIENSAAQNFRYIFFFFIFLAVPRLFLLSMGQYNV